MASLAACASREQAEAQFEKLIQLVQEAIQFMPSFRSLFLCGILNTKSLFMEKHIFGDSLVKIPLLLLFRLEEQTLAQCNKSDLRRVSSNHQCR